MTEGSWMKAIALIKEIAVRHRAAFEKNDSEAMGRLEEETLLVCDAYDYPVNSPNLLLASYWP